MKAGEFLNHPPNMQPLVPPFLVRGYGCLFWFFVFCIYIHAYSLVEFLCKHCTDTDMCTDRKIVVYMLYCCSVFTYAICLPTICRITTDSIVRGLAPWRNPCGNPPFVLLFPALFFVEFGLLLVKWDMRYKLIFVYEYCVRFDPPDTRDVCYGDL